MDKTHFDAARFVQINLDTGTISSVANDRLALIPLSVLQSLVPDATLAEVARGWGISHGRLLTQRMDMDAEETGLQALASHLGGTVAALGLGTLRVEVLRDALTFRAKQPESFLRIDGVSALMEGFLAGYLNALGDYAFHAVYLGREDGDDVFWVGNEDVAADVRRLKAGGAPPDAIVQSLIAGNH